MRLQYQLSNASWVDCGARTEEFLDRCVKFGRVGGRKDVLNALTAGKTVRNDSAGWYSFCRDGEAFDQKMMAIRKRLALADKQPLLRCKRCGQTGKAGAYPFSTLPGSGLCDDCV